jgi:RES domain
VIVWRFSRQESLDGRGGLLASARWHTRGLEILYCAPNPATAVLEILVHSQVREPAALSRHRFIKLEIPDEISRDSVDARERFDLVARRRPAHVKLLKSRSMSNTAFRSTITTVAIAAHPPGSGCSRCSMLKKSMRRGRDNSLIS